MIKRCNGGRLRAPVRSSTDTGTLTKADGELSVIFVSFATSRFCMEQGQHGYKATSSALTKSSRLRQSCSWYGLFWNGCPHDRWNEIGRDCYLAFAASFHTNGIGSDTEVGLRKQLMKAGAEVITACSEWIKVAEKAPEDVDHGYSAWDLSEVYSAYFVSRANWLGVRAAKCKSVHPDTTDNIALGAPGWHHRFDETILCIHRKWISNADALAEFTSLAELLLEVTLVDVQKRYPEVYSEMADCMTSDGWPTMYIWPVPKSC